MDPEHLQGLISGLDRSLTSAKHIRQHITCES